mgnify:CR=1 FL=1
MAKIAIGIPCFNEEPHIAGTLLSAIQQLEHCSDLEILVSDNKSSDRTVSKVEDILGAVAIAKDRVTLVKQDKNIGANENFWHVYDNTDSELFMWLGSHDQISAGYAQRGLAHMSEFSNTALFSGKHRALNADGAVTDHPISYDFLQENPIERYLQSIVQLSNCYIFHSIFRRKDFLNFQRISAPGADHILISHLLWSGVLHQSDNCFYSRRYFSKANREAKSAQGAYPHERNNMEFYDAYLQDLTQLVQPLPDLVGEAIITQAANLLIQRFGLPFFSHPE